jgi:hypothetical protein
MIGRVFPRFLSVRFYAIGAANPTLIGHFRAPLSGWGSLREELASYYDRPEESFGASEVYWNGDEDSAEVVTMDGRILGAIDRPVSQADVATIWGVDRVQKRAFMNRIRSLRHIEGYMLPELSPRQQSEFVRDPLQYFLNADDDQSDAIMREVEKRQIGEKVSDWRTNFSTPAIPEQGRPSFELKAEGYSSAKKPVTAKPPRAKKAKPKVDGQREMLLPISGKKAAGEKKATQGSMPGRKAG